MRGAVDDLLIGLGGEVGCDAVVVVCLFEEGRAEGRGVVNGTGLHFQSRGGVEANVDEVNGVCLISDPV